ncbi:PREDICTED: uncharacterized protein LOC108516791 [Rhinopithecus bieti]|uniref:uncharacterized protein LOC108516791 n=1 Tax=Rhinopithecus bieti TaxID=61621 RepID=UPI00083C259F|nr:PREDICTED: uncharacterized protein LOC108516791 [Rhinopithecus bieti]
MGYVSTRCHTHSPRVHTTHPVSTRSHSVYLHMPCPHALTLMPCPDAHTCHVHTLSHTSTRSPTCAVSACSHASTCSQLPCPHSHTCHVHTRSHMCHVQTFTHAVSTRSHTSTCYHTCRVHTLSHTCHVHSHAMSTRCHTCAVSRRLHAVYTFSHMCCPHSYAMSTHSHMPCPHVLTCHVHTFTHTCRVHMPQQTTELVCAKTRAEADESLGAGMEGVRGPEEQPVAWAAPTPLHTLLLAQGPGIELHPQAVQLLAPHLTEASLPQPSGPHARAGLTGCYSPIPAVRPRLDLSWDPTHQPGGCHTGWGRE